ncbi:MAG: hypothetical protein HUJ96_02860 [Marinilabiliaceae bacterium]|nr:hypothetical protein [Marinilabiliaceae bacterium]
MEQIIIKHADGTSIQLPSYDMKAVVSSASITDQLMSSHQLDITIQSAVPLGILIGDTCEVFGEVYTLLQLPQIARDGERSLTYTLKMESLQYRLLDVQYFLVDASGTMIPTTNEAYTATLNEFIRVIVANANRPGLTDVVWKVGNITPNEEVDITMTLSYEEYNCLAALQDICTQFEVEFSIRLDGNNAYIDVMPQIGSTFPFTFAYGRGNGLYSLDRSNQDGKDIVTRLFVYGSSDNLPAGYRHSKLCLPGKSQLTSFVQRDELFSAYGLREGMEVLTDIKPQRYGTITSVSSVNVFIDTSMDFDLNEKDDKGQTKWFIADTTAQIQFTSGQLAGYSFDIASYNHVRKTFTINPFTDENGLTFPNPDSAAFQFAAGDKYFIVGIRVPDSYVDAAEAQLADMADKYINQYSQPQPQYSLAIDPRFLHSIYGDENVSVRVFKSGDKIKIYDSVLSESVIETRIQSVTIDLLSPYSYQLTLGDTEAVSTIMSVLGNISTINKVVADNDLTNTAQMRRRWRANEELKNMVFDPDGHYYSDKIAPLSIDTTMLSVGAKSQQFSLINVVFTPNYQGNANRINITGGTLQHYALAEDILSWTISNSSYSNLNASTAYYIYARCNRVTSGTGTGIIIIDTTQHVVDENPSYYYFLIGTLSSVIDNAARILSLTYGSTTINGKFVKTGVISSNDGSVQIDLDNGTITSDKGITFKNSAGQSTNIQNYVDGKIDDVEVDVTDAKTKATQAQETALQAKLTANEAKTSAQTTAIALNNVDSDGIFSTIEKRAMQPQWKAINGVADTTSSPTTAGTYQTTLTNATSAGIATTHTKYVALTTAYNNLKTYLNAVGLYSGTNYTFTSTYTRALLSTRFTEYHRAEIDLSDYTADVLASVAESNSKAYTDAVEIGGRNLLTNSTSCTFTGRNTTNTNIHIPSGVNTLRKGTYTWSIESFSAPSGITTFSMTLRIGSSDYVGASVRQQSDGRWVGKVVLSSDLAVSTSTYIHIWMDVPASSSYSIPMTHIKLENGSRATAWTLAPEDTDASIAEAMNKANELQYLKDTFNEVQQTGEVKIVGGLALGSMMAVKNSNGNITAVMNGIVGTNPADSIAFAAGGDGVTTNAPFVVRHDGSVDMSKAKITSGSVAGQQINISGNSINVGSVTGDNTQILGSPSGGVYGMLSKAGISGGSTSYVSAFTIGSAVTSQSQIASLYVSSEYIGGTYRYYIKENITGKASSTASRTLLTSSQTTNAGCLTIGSNVTRAYSLSTLTLTTSQSISTSYYSYVVTADTKVGIYKNGSLVKEGTLSVLYNGSTSGSILYDTITSQIANAKIPFQAGDTITMEYSTSLSISIKLDVEAQTIGREVRITCTAVNYSATASIPQSQYVFQMFNNILYNDGLFLSKTSDSYIAMSAVDATLIFKAWCAKAGIWLDQTGLMKVYKNDKKAEIPACVFARRLTLGTSSLTINTSEGFDYTGGTVTGSCSSNVYTLTFGTPLLSDCPIVEFNNLSTTEGATGIVNSRSKNAVQFRVMRATTLYNSGDIWIYIYA